MGVVSGPRSRPIHLLCWGRTTKKTRRQRWGFGSEVTVLWSAGSWRPDHRSGSLQGKGVRGSPRTLVRKGLYTYPHMCRCVTTVVFWGLFGFGPRRTTDLAPDPLPRGRLPSLSTPSPGTRH